jgi:hypothetical protein
VLAAFFRSCRLTTIICLFRLAAPTRKGELFPARLAGETAYKMTSEIREADWRERQEILRAIEAGGLVRVRAPAEVTAGYLELALTACPVQLSNVRC